MSRDELQQVAATVERAADRTDSTEVRERLQAQSAEFDDLATADRGPDHGKLARHEHILSEIAEESPDVADDIEDALEAIHAYRETIEGV